VLAMRPTGADTAAVCSSYRIQLHAQYSQVSLDNIRHYQVFVDRAGPLRPRLHESAQLTAPPRFQLIPDRTVIAAVEGRSPPALVADRWRPRVDKPLAGRHRRCAPPA
jgi:hypothetical protein